MIDFGRHGEIELPYPTHTHVRLIDQSPLRTRRLIVHDVRDLVIRPLTPAEFLRRPYIARSRWLIRAWDIDRKAFRQFYLGNSPASPAPGCLRIVLADSERDPPRLVVSRGFDPTVTDRRALVRLLSQWLSREPELASKLKIAADDLRLRRA